MCLKTLAKNDALWRKIAFNICGNKDEADEIVQEMYLRRYENDRGQDMNEWYVASTLKSVYLNRIKRKKRDIPKEHIYTGATDNKFEPNDAEQRILDEAKKLSYNQRELLELSYDYSFREIQKEFNVNYGYSWRETKKAREQILGGDLSNFKNSRLKYKKMGNQKDEEYYKSLDKRTKEYKEWAKSRESVGLGTTIAKVLEATGVKKIVELVTNGDCGCKEREQALNKLFKYQEKPQCLTEEQINDYKRFIDNRKVKLIGKGKATGILAPVEIDFICELYAIVFSRKVWKPSCYSCTGSIRTLISMIYKLETVYYNNI